MPAGTWQDPVLSRVLITLRTIQASYAGVRINTVSIDTKSRIPSLWAMAGLSQKNRTGCFSHIETGPEAFQFCCFSRLNLLLFIAAMARCSAQKVSIRTDPCLIGEANFALGFVDPLKRLTLSSVSGRNVRLQVVSHPTFTGADPSSDQLHTRTKLSERYSDGEHNISSAKRSVLLPEVEAQRKQLSPYLSIQRLRALAFLFVRVQLRFFADPPERPCSIRPSLASLKASRRHVCTRRPGSQKTCSRTSSGLKPHCLPPVSQ